MKPDPDAKAAFLEAVQQQLSSPETPEVKREFERLKQQGVTEEQALEMIGAILSFHTARMLQGEAAFDYPAYVEELRRLPEMADEEEL